jgi:PAS domain S-box-containing protein
VSVVDTIEESEPTAGRAPGRDAAMLAAILDGMGVGLYVVDRDWRIVLFNNEAERHFGRPRHEMIGHGLWEVFPTARDTALGRQFHAAMATRQPITSETASVVMSDRWLEFRLFPAGEGLGVRFRDISDRKRAEAHRDLLIGELNHRVRNTLATVQAIAAQTLGSAGVDPGVQRALEARLIALSTVHNVLTEENWSSADLHDLVWSALRPHGADRPRFTVEGPGLRVRPNGAVALSMALHELCTNAIKYGALSVAAGHVSVAWTAAQDRFRLHWRESGGPAVAAPGRRGFGSRLIERGIAAELLGAAEIAYEPAGVVCTIEAPLEAIREPTGGEDRERGLRRPNEREENDHG